MWGFEITFDLLIVAIIAQTIAIALIILIIYLKIKKIHHKNIDLNEKIMDKINNIESKLSYLSDKVLTISINHDKFSSSVASMDPAGNYRFKDSTNYESDSLDQLTDPTLESQNIRDSEIVEARLSTISKPKNSENNSIPIPGTIPTSPSTVGSMYTSTTSVPSITAKSPLTPEQDSSMQISTSNNPDCATVQDKALNFGRNDNEPIHKRLTDNDRLIEKNTNPEIEKIEQEILTTLIRLGGNDEDDSVSSNNGSNKGSNNGGSDAGVGVDTLRHQSKKSQIKNHNNLTV